MSEPPSTAPDASHIGRGELFPLDGADLWIDHDGVLPAIENAVAGGDCRAVFIVGGYGFGATALLNRLAERYADEATVLSIHASPALEAVPYGALAPFLGGIKVPSVSSQVVVLRAIWDRLQAQRTQEGPVLLLLDDAHVLDNASAEIITELVRAGWATVIATAKPHPGLPGALARLWDEGWAEKFDLQPLGPAQVHELCTALLGGTVVASASRSLWAATGGNPLMVKTLLHEYRLDGVLVHRNGVWLLTPAGYAGQRLELGEVVGMQLRRLSAGAREMLNLIALAEPVEQAQVAALLGEGPLDELLVERLVGRGGPSGHTLRLLNPLYGDVLRQSIPVTASMELHRRFLSTAPLSLDEPESLLRFVIWSLDCGTPVADELLMRAAVLACKIFQNDAALRIGAAVQDPALHSRTAAVMARAHFNMGNYAQAAVLLEPVGAESADVGEMMLGSLLRAATRTALGHPGVDVAADAAALRAWGRHESERSLAAGRADDAAAVLAETTARSTVLDLLAASMVGEYAAMGALSAEIRAAEPLESGPGLLLTRAMLLALEAERLCAVGRPLAGKAEAEAAFAIVQPEGHDVFFLPEFILVRLLTCCLAAGEWGQAEELMDDYFLTSGLAMVSFSGAIHVGIGYVAVRQGNLHRALPVLLAGLEALHDSDPEHMLPLCGALAYYTAAALGDAEKAHELAGEYLDGGNAGIHLVAAIAGDFFNAGTELLRRDGTGTAALLASADAAAAGQTRFLELHALELAVSLGDRSRLERFTALAAGTEGPWAAALAKYGWALRSPDVTHLLRAGDALREATMFANAAHCYDTALGMMGRNHDRELIPRVRELLAQCRTGTGEDDDGVQEGARQPGVLLTRREREVAALVLEGLGDKEIAAALHLSVRTVEGHLYRCYTKLGITSRAELAGAMEFQGSED